LESQVFCKLVGNSQVDECQACQEASTRIGVDIPLDEKDFRIASSVFCTRRKIRQGIAGWAKSKIGTSSQTSGVYRDSTSGRRLSRVVDHQGHDKAHYTAACQQ
jgi:hypothetical protein